MLQELLHVFVSGIVHDWKNEKILNLSHKIIMYMDCINCNINCSIHLISYFNLSSSLLLIAQFLIKISKSFSTTQSDQNKRHKLGLVVVAKELGGRGCLKASY